MIKFVVNLWKTYVAPQALFISLHELPLININVKKYIITIKLIITLTHKNYETE